jgi:hypothetical protein
MQANPGGGRRNPRDFLDVGWSSDRIWDARSIVWRVASLPPARCVAENPLFALDITRRQPRDCDAAANFGSWSLAAPAPLACNELMVERAG